MNTVELLTFLKKRDVQIQLDGEQLRINAPKDALTPELKEELKAKKAEILAFLRNAGLGRESDEHPIARMDRSGQIPLSFPQQRLWFMDQLVPGSAAYIIPLSLRWRGQVNLEILEKSLTEIARRHEVMRTIFTATDGVPRQVVMPPRPVIIDVTDLTRLSLEESEKEASRMAAENALEGFDLAKGPLLRVRLVRLASEDQVLLVAIHHIVFDGWSIGVLTGELTALYPAFLNGKASPLSEPPIQYADFAQWQRNHIAGRLRETQLAYWKNELSGRLIPLELPSDRPRSSLQAASGAKCSRRLGRQQTSDLKALGQKQGVSLFMILLAVFEILLHRLSGQVDILVGTPVAGRNRAETEGLLGFFVNTLVMRGDFSRHISFLELLAQVSRNTLDAYAHQDIPFEELVSILEPRRDLNRAPLFQVFFNHLNLDAPRLEIEGLEMEPFGDYTLESKFDLTIYVTEEKGALQLLLVYNQHLFNQDRMTTFLEQYESLLDNVCRDPAGLVDRYSLVIPSSRNRWPDPTLPIKKERYKCLPEQFVEQAASFPDRLAVEDSDGRWNYGELEKLSGGLAGWITSRKIGGGDIVAIVGHRSAPLVLAILGVLRAGAAFCIIDPSYPEARLARILRLAKPKALIRIQGSGGTPRWLTELADELTGENQLALPKTSHVNQLLELKHTSAPPGQIDSDSLAYVTFTSGTTGQPKCIIGTHNPLAHFVQWHGRNFKLTKEDRFSMLSGLAHDPLLRDVFTPLCLGAMLYIPDAEEMLAPGYLIEWMRRHEITAAHLTPAMGSLLLDGDRIKFDALRHVFFAGEVLSPLVAARMSRAAPTAEIVNFYGTTETPQAMAWHRIDPSMRDLSDDETAQKASPIPIGKPIPGVQILILNVSGGLAGTGEIGEIYVRTPYLSLGYANDDDLTNERFVLNPFTDQAQDRMYRTGDLGRYLPDGAIEFAGRVDHQIKIRGYRVELGEIEAILGACQNIRQCAVALRRGATPGSDALVAYVVPDAGPQPAASEIRAYLRSFLPEYMVPAAFVHLEKIPFTPNGKIDRKSLPIPTDDLSPRTEEASVLPRDKVESMMADIWSEVLGRKPIGIFEHFFELGGHSLSATKLISRLNSALRIQIPLKSLFTDPTIAALAALIRYDEVDDVYYYIGEPSRWKLLVPAQPKGSLTPFFFIGGYMDPNDTLRILSNLIPHLGFDQPVYGLQPRWLDGQSQRYSSVGEVVAEFVTELRAFRPHGPYLLGGDCVGGIIALEMARMLISQGEKVALLAMFDSERPTFLRDFAADLRIAYRRSKRICQKIGQLLTWDNPLKKQLVQDIFRRKGIPLQSQNRTETFDERTYRLRVDYRRMIYCYRVRKYPGKITMIVNESQYRVDKTMGWTGIPVTFEVHVTPGDHWTRYVKYGREIAAVLTQCIARAKDE